MTPKTNLKRALLGNMEMRLLVFKVPSFSGWGRGGRGVCLAPKGTRAGGLPGPLAVPGGEGREVLKPCLDW